MVEKISKFTLWGLLGISILIVILFCTIGFDTPFEDNPTFKDPQLTDVLLCWTYFLIAACAIVTVCSAIHTLTVGGQSFGIKGLADKVSGPVAWGTFVVALGAGIAMGMANQNETLLINGKDWNNPVDIILTDASMISIIVLTVVTIAATVWSMVSSKN